MIYELKTYRLAHGLTQLQMGELLGLSKSHISMIEIGKRALPHSANTILTRLQQKTENDPSQVASVSEENYLGNLVDTHRKTSGDYIAIYCGDLRSEMHRLNKSILAWTDKYNEAGRNLFKIRHMLSHMRKNNNLSSYTYDSLMVERMAAENQIREVLKQKPELALIRIEGIKKELEAAKKLLKKHNRFPVIDNLTQFYQFNITTPELPPSTSGNLTLPEPSA